MPYAIEGLNETLRALRKYSPDLYKEMNKEIVVELKQLREKARSFIPNEISGLSSWVAAETKYNSEGKRVSFPAYDSKLARKGITYSVARKRQLKDGWYGYYALFNRSASGAIIETAGRQNPQGRGRRNSDNPNASKHFIDSIQSRSGSFKQLNGVKSSRKQQGRVIYRAVVEDEGRARMHIVKAIETANNRFRTRKA